MTGLKDYDGVIFADLFSGTGVVGTFYRRLGCKVYTNDIQYYAYVLAKHYIENNPDDLRMDLFDHFNSLEGREGFIYKNYCAGSGSGRNYFTDENGKKCDAIRMELERLYKEKEINEKTYFFYLASLINSIDKYANTASIYGAFLKHIKKSAAKTFRLESLEAIEGRSGEVLNDDAVKAVRKLSGTILYLDPPYNSRQYCSNYHMLETVARYDNPELFGKTGLREAGVQKSKWCSKKLVEQEFEEMIKNADFAYIFLSYNNEGLMSLETIKRIMSKYGEYSVHTKTYKRFKADRDENRNTGEKETIEYLHCLKKKNED